MSVSKFIPKVWSARLQEKLRKNLIFGGLCNRSYEGDISQYGDTVHINALSDITVHTYRPGEDIEEPEALDGTDTTLRIEHAVYCNFYLSDVDAAQSRADIMDTAMRNAARCLAEDTEDYILSVIRAGAGTKVTKSIPAGGIYDLVVDIKTALDEKHVPRTGRALVMPPSVEGLLLKDSRFITAGGSITQQAIAEVAVPLAVGFDIYISTDLTNEIVAMTEDGVAFAQQITGMEAYRREKGFDDGVKGLSLCGAKVIQPDCVYLCTLSQ